MSLFSQTQSIQSFAIANGISDIRILRNPKTGKLFASADNGATFRLSDKVQALSMDLKISWFSPEDGEASFMIHPEGSGAEIVSTMSFGAPAVAKAEPATLAEL
jgi:hypothetical protein